MARMPSARCAWERRAAALKIVTLVVRQAWGAGGPVLRQITGPQVGGIGSVGPLALPRYSVLGGDGIEPGAEAGCSILPGFIFRQARTEYKSPLLQSLQSNLHLQHLSRRTEDAYVYGPSGSSVSVAFGTLPSWA
jgi:hypothetical protein